MPMAARASCLASAQALDCACGLYLGDTTAWLDPRRLGLALLVIATAQPVSE